MFNITNGTSTESRIYLQLSMKSIFSYFLFKFLFFCCQEVVIYLVKIISNFIISQVKTDMDFEIVSREECSVMGDREEMYSKLEQDLISQVENIIICTGSFLLTVQK